jgi:acyl-CoA reductase-like NAD-dependent aldehyde dehydrogenase
MQKVQNIFFTQYVFFIMQVGTVWVNCHGSIDAGVPFGGWKQSGVGVVGGKEGITLVSCLLFYFEIFVCI